MAEPTTAERSATKPKLDINANANGGSVPMEVSATSGNVDLKADAKDHQTSTTPSPTATSPTPMAVAPTSVAASSSSTTNVVVDEPDKNGRATAGGHSNNNNSSSIGKRGKDEQQPDAPIMVRMTPDQVPPRPPSNFVNEGMQRWLEVRAAWNPNALKPHVHKLPKLDEFDVRNILQGLRNYRRFPRNFPLLSVIEICILMWDDDFMNGRT